MNGNGLTRTPEEWTALAEERLSRRNVGDTFTPAFMTVDSNGNVTFDFSGHVKAEGLDLPTDIDFTSGDPSTIRWLHPELGTEQARLWGLLDTAGEDFAMLMIWANHPQLSPRSRVIIRAMGPVEESELSVVSHTATVEGSVTALAGRAGIGGGLVNRMIINGEDESDFLQMGGQLGGGTKTFLSEVDIVNVPIVAPGAAAAVNGKLWAILEADGPVPSVQVVGSMSGAGRHAIWGINNIPTNNATQFQIQFRFQNDGAANTIVTSFSYRLLTTIPIA